MITVEVKVYRIDKNQGCFKMPFPPSVGDLMVDPNEEPNQSWVVRSIQHLIKDGEYVHTQVFVDLAKEEDYGDTG